MSTVTATINVGQEHPNHGGMMSRLAASMQLTENSRPCWMIRNLETGSRRLGLKLYPTLDNTIGDAFLLMACSLELINEPSEEMFRFFDRLKLGGLTMPDLPEEIRQRLYRECQACSETFPKTVIAIYEPGSLIYAQTEQLRAYQNSMALLMPKYVRARSHWGEPKVFGKL
jgi:hypothetical protein